KYVEVLKNDSPSNISKENEIPTITNIIGVGRMTRSGQVSKEAAHEFYKFIKQNEYQVVYQLNRTPTKISVLSLLMNSEPQRMALMKILN
ncbi:hypothetical protein HN51_050389, partial [Arachis hypogaea]